MQKIPSLRKSACICDVLSPERTKSCWTAREGCWSGQGFGLHELGSQGLPRRIHEKKEKVLRQPVMEAYVHTE